MAVIQHTCDRSHPCMLCGRGVLKILGRSPISSRHPLPTVPCSLLGDPLTGHEREARGLDHRRAWNWCGHPAKPLGTDAVCRCLGCGPGCGGYSTPVPSDLS